jgi:hypothetical protein
VPGRSSQTSRCPLTRALLVRPSLDTHRTEPAKVVGIRPGEDQLSRYLADGRNVRLQSPAASTRRLRHRRAHCPARPEQRLPASTRANSSSTELLVRPLDPHRAAHFDQTDQRRNRLSWKRLTPGPRRRRTHCYPSRQELTLGCPPDAHAEDR